jgi:hypothetical protein
MVLEWEIWGRLSIFIKRLQGITCFLMNISISYYYLQKNTYQFKQERLQENIFVKEGNNFCRSIQQLHKFQILTLSLGNIKKRYFSLINLMFTYSPMCTFFMRCTILSVSNQHLANFPAQQSHNFIRTESIGLAKSHNFLKCLTAGIMCSINCYYRKHWKFNILISKLSCDYANKAFLLVLLY